MAAALTPDPHETSDEDDEDDYLRNVQRSTPNEFELLPVLLGTLIC